MWVKRDWQQYFEVARRPWQRHRPPRPIYPTGINRVCPAAGFSFSELDDAGINLDLAERLGLRWTRAASGPTSPTCPRCAILCAPPASPPESARQAPAGLELPLRPLYSLGAF